MVEDQEFTFYSDHCRVRAYSKPLHKAMLSGNVVSLQDVSKIYTLDMQAAIETMFVLIDYSAQNRHITPLQAAVITGHYLLCKHLIHEGAKFLSLSYDIKHPLNIALDLGRYEIAELLITSGADVSLVQHRLLPMYFAIKRDSPSSIVETMIKAGCSPDAVTDNFYCCTALHRAVACNNVPVVKILMKYKASCDTQEHYKGETALHIAVKQNLPTMVELLAEYGAELNIECKEGCTPLFHALGVDSQECLEILLKHGANIHHLSPVTQNYPLNFAVRLVRKTMTHTLLKRGADAKLVSPCTGNSPLHSAAMTHRGKVSTLLMKDLTDIVLRLIEEGAEIDLPNKCGYTPMQVAIKEENFTIVQLLVEEGSSVNQTLDLSTNFHFVSKLAGKEVVKTFLEHGADYTVVDKNGVTPYHLSLLKPDTAVINLFFKYFCPWNLPSSDNLIKPKFHPIAKKAIENQQKLERGILENDINVMYEALKDGAEVRGCSMEMPHPLHFAVASGFNQVVSMLLDKGFPVNCLNDMGETPLYLAASQGNYYICEYLLRFGACHNPRSRSTGYRPIDIATINNHYPVFYLLNKVNKLFQCKTEDKIICEISKWRDYHECSALALINCVDSKGDNLLGMALRKRFRRLSSFIMDFRLKMVEDVKMSKL